MLTLQGAPAWDSAGNIDWNLVKESDPSLIRKLRDVDALQPLMDCFLDARVDTTALSHPLAPRLFQLMQVSIEYLLTSQKELTTRLDKAETECKKLKNQLQVAKSSQRKAKAAYQSRSEELDKARELIEKLRLPSETCPTCGKKFKAGEFLDQHYAKKHPSLESYWRAIRTSAPVMVAQEDIRGLIKEIKELKKETTERHGRARRRFEDAKRVVDEREMGIEEELTATHDDLRADIIAAAEAARARQRTMRVNPAIDIFEPARVNVSNPFAPTTYQRTGVYDPAADARAAQLYAQQQHPMPPEYAQSPMPAREPLYNSVRPYYAPEFYPQSPAHPYQITRAETVREPELVSGKKGNPIELAKRFLNDDLRQERFRMDSDQMEEMIASVSQRIQAEIAGVRDTKLSRKTPTPSRKRKPKTKSVEPVQRRVPKASERTRSRNLSNSDPEHEELLAVEDDSEEDVIETMPEQELDEIELEEEIQPRESARGHHQKHKRRRSQIREKIEEPEVKRVEVDSSSSESEGEEPVEERKPPAAITITYAAKKKPYKIDPEPAPKPEPKPKPKPKPEPVSEETDPFALRESGDDFVIESSSKSSMRKKPELKRAPQPQTKPVATPPRTEFKITNSELDELMASTSESAKEEPAPVESKSPRGLVINNSELDALLAISESETPTTLPKPEKRPIEDDLDEEDFNMGTHPSLEGSQTFQTSDARGFRGAPPKSKRLLHFTDF